MVIMCPQSADAISWFYGLLLFLFLLLLAFFRFLEGLLLEFFRVAAGESQVLLLSVVLAWGGLVARQGGLDIQPVVPHQGHPQTRQLPSQQPVAEVLKNQLHHGDGRFPLLALALRQVVADQKLRNSGEISQLACKGREVLLGCMVGPVDLLAVLMKAPAGSACEQQVVVIDPFAHVLPRVEQVDRQRHVQRGSHSQLALLLLQHPSVAVPYLLGQLLLLYARTHRHAPQMALLQLPQHSEVLAVSQPMQLPQGFLLQLPTAALGVGNCQPRLEGAFGLATVVLGLDVGVEGGVGEVAFAAAALEVSALFILAGAAGRCLFEFCVGERLLLHLTIVDQNRQVLMKIAESISIHQIVQTLRDDMKELDSITGRMKNSVQP